MIQLTTPALLFSAISLLMLAFTNRFLAIASLIRQLHNNKSSNQEYKVVVGQIENLKKRLYLIRNMQAWGVLAFFFCVVSMICLYFDRESLAYIFFGISLFNLLAALLLSLIEIFISTKALEIELGDLAPKRSLF
jgi:hypothetical protein